LQFFIFLQKDLRTNFLVLKYIPLFKILTIKVSFSFQTTDRTSVLVYKTNKSLIFKIIFQQNQMAVNRNHLPRVRLRSCMTITINNKHFTLDIFESSITKAFSSYGQIVVMILTTLAPGGMGGPFVQVTWPPGGRWFMVLVDVKLM